MLKHTLLALAVVLCGAAHAEDVLVTCQESVAQKKLAGAAATSHLKKCERDAKAACEAKSADKKLSGAAKTSFEKKCVKDALGAAPAP